MLVLEAVCGGDELLTPEEMSRTDRLAVAHGVDSFDLMRRAGAAVAASAGRMAGSGELLVLAGPGNNGGDALVAAAELRAQGRQVRVALLAEPASLSGDAARAREMWGDQVQLADEDLDWGSDLILDGLFGAGLQRPLEGRAAYVVEAANAASRPILAIDLPSGIDGRTGEVKGTAIRAARTVTFFRLKPGHLLYPGRGCCGAVELAQIGIPDSVLEEISPFCFRNGPALWGSALRPPDATAHKYDRGHVCVLSGPAYSTGAARLAAAAALRIGAGAVTVVSPPDALLVNAAHLTAIMVRRFDTPDDLAEFVAERRVRATVAGPGSGVGEGTRATIEALLATDTALVLDADALTSFANAPESLFGAITGRAAPVVLTPHGGEFARLFGSGGVRIDRARQAAARSGAVVILKGPDTVIAAPDGRAAINDNAPPHLATAGSGDVLAGMAAGLLAQGLPPFQAASAAVWLHGAAGAALGRGLTAEDLPGALPGVLQRLEASEG
jgi:ADP-dependent NAD(P)H-hydrate dehydratase / NAD(P)H-hydrate epimerase